MSQKDDTLEYLREVMPNLKYYKTDLAIDLLKIFNDRANRFKDSGNNEELASVTRHIRDLKPYVMAPRIKNKLYIVADIERILLISFGISDFEIKVLTEICDEPEKFDIPPEYISSLYIFDKDEQILTTDIYPGELSNFIKHFNSRNLIIDYDTCSYDSRFDIFGL